MKYWKAQLLAVAALFALAMIVQVIVGPDAATNTVRVALWVMIISLLAVEVAALLLQLFIWLLWDDQIEPEADDRPAWRKALNLAMDLGLPVLLAVTGNIALSVAFVLALLLAQSNKAFASWRASS